MFGTQQNFRDSRNYLLPSTKLRNVFCIYCRRQFFVQAFVALRGLVPLLLDCGHVICEKCARTVDDKPCPLCNVHSQSRRSDQGDQKTTFPVNLYMLGLMVVSHNRPINMDEPDISFSQSNNSKLKQQSIPGMCHECGNQATVKCLQCVALYCQICYLKIHGRALQNHIKVNLNEGNNEYTGIVSSRCSEQCMEPLGYYCESCQKAGCSHCILHFHQHHNYMPLIKKNQQLLPEFRKMTDRVTESLQRIRQAQKKLQSTASSPTDVQNIDSLEATITQHFAHLHGVLQNTEKKIVQALSAYRPSIAGNIDEISQQLKAQEDHLQPALQGTDYIAENLDKVDLQQVIDKLRKLADMPCHLVQDSGAEDKQLGLNIDRSIVDTIEKHCCLELPSVSTFSLQRSELLPDDYEIEPLTEAISIPTKSFEHKSPTVTKFASDMVYPPEKTDKHLTVGSSEMVRVTHVVDPSCFYVQVVQNQNKLRDLSKGLASFANGSVYVPEVVTLNALYVVRSSKDSMWYRGRVVDKKVLPTGNLTYTVLFVDYGMKEENVLISSLRTIVPTFAMLPVMAIKCTLFDVVPNDGGNWQPDAIQAFKKLVCTTLLVSMCVMMITGDTYYVDMCAVSSKDSGLISIKDSLTYMKYATCVSPNKLARLISDSTKKYYKEQLELATYTGVQILFVESPSCIYVKKVQEVSTSYFSKLVREMTEDYEQNLFTTEFIHEPRKDLPCAARGVDGYWYRGVVCELTETSVKVLYVDLGYTLVLSHDAIRTLSKKYMNGRTRAIKVSLRNIKPTSEKDNVWHSDSTEFLKKFFTVMKTCTVIAFEKIEDTYSVAMYTHDRISVSYLLIKNGLALDTASSPRSAHVNTKSKRRRRKSKNVDTATEVASSYAVRYKPYDKDTSARSNSSSKETEDPFKVSVRVHKVESPDCIYVSDAAYGQSEIEDMMTQIQEIYFKYRSPQREDWSKNAVCAVYSPKSDIYYRARIVEIKSKEEVVMFLFDTGIEETVAMKDIQPLYPTFFKIPAYIFKIKLSGILPCGGSTNWPSLSTEELRNIISSNQNGKFYISQLEEEDVANSAIPVELWIKEKKMDGPLAPTRIEINSVNRMLVEKGVAFPVREYAKKRDKILAVELKRQLVKKLKKLLKYESNVTWLKKFDDEPEDSVDTSIKKEMETLLNSLESDSDCENCGLEEMFELIPTFPKLSAWFPADPITEDSFIAIPTSLDNNGFLYLHSKAQTKRIEYIESKLDELYKDCKIETCDTVWTSGDICIARYHVNNKWYRGRVLRVLENDSVEVEFVDYGNIEDCAIGGVKKKVILEDIPIQCTKCIIYDLCLENENRKWATDDLDKIHSLLVDQECKVSILDRTGSFPLISLTLLPSQKCNRECDLVTFLVNNLGMKIKSINKSNIFEKFKPTNTANVTIEDSESCCLDNDALRDTIISGCSTMLHTMNSVNKDESCATTDIENLSWCKVNDDIITSTPHVVSEENLSMNYKPIDVPPDVDFIEVELCCSISVTEFYVHLKENTHSTILNTIYSEYESLMKELQEDACKQPMITSLALNTPCCAKFSDGLWYRCFIEESEPIRTDDFEVKLHYVDYGNAEYRTVNSQQCELYALKKEWMDLPALAIKCKLWNVEVVSTADQALLCSQLEKLYNKLVIATIKEMDDGFMNVELYKDTERKELLYSTLIEEDLLRIKLKTN